MTNNESHVPGLIAQQMEVSFIKNRNTRTDSGVEMLGKGEIMDSVLFVECRSPVEDLNQSISR